MKTGSRRLSFVFLAGLLAGLVLPFLLGANSGGSHNTIVTSTSGEPVVLVSTPATKERAQKNSRSGGIGRYQLSAWSTNWGESGGGYGAFVIDTTTGETKIAYNYVFADNGKERIRIDNLGKPFRRISP